MHLRTRLFRLGAAACVASASIVAFVPGISNADSPPEVGYWSRALPLQDDSIEPKAGSEAVIFSSAQQVPDPTIPQGPITTVPLPVPAPTVPDTPVTIPETGQPNPTGDGAPEGGFWVGNDSTGANAVSALRFRGDIGEARLTIKFASGSTIVSPLVACPVLSNWSTEVNGPWKNRPAHDCERLEISGRLSTGGDAMVFDIPQGFTSFAENKLEIMVLPNRTAGDNSSMFFEAPTNDSLETYSTQDLPEYEGNDVAEYPAANFESSDGGFDGPVLGRDTFDSGSFTVDSTTPVDTTSNEVAAPQVAPVADALNPIEALTESRVGRIICVALLLALGGVMFWLGGQPTRSPRLIGGLATGPGAALAIASDDANHRSRGIGRFRSIRDAKPNRL
jgi:hypothetical protein